MSLLVLDWGIGGLATLKALRARAPHLPLLYLSDAGFTPYGRVPHEALGARLEALCEAIESLHGPLSGLMVACNAASSALTPALKLPLTLSVIESGVEATLDALAQLPQLRELYDPLRVGVVGGEATIRSRLYERALTARAEAHLRAPLDVLSVVAQPISAHVEAGRLSGPELEADLELICAPLRGVHALTLACTHYPAVRERFSAQLPHALLIDPLEHFVARGLERWGAPPLARSPSPSPAPLSLYTTGDVGAFVEGARLAWGLNMSDLNVSEAQLKRLDPHLLTPLPAHPATHLPRQASDP